MLMAEQAGRHNVTDGPAGPCAWWLVLGVLGGKSHYKLVHSGYTLWLAVLIMSFYMMYIMPS
jgi:hypothetical protein